MTISGTGEPTVDPLNGIRLNGDADAGRDGATFRLRELPLKNGMSLGEVCRMDGQPYSDVVTANLISVFVHRGSHCTPPTGEPCRRGRAS